MARTILDLSEFLANPLRTGIQRVVGELCRNWPAGAEKTIARIAPDGQLAEVDVAVQQAVVDFFSSGGQGASARIRSLADRAGECGQRVRLESTDRLLVPEVFYEERRLDYYDNLLRTRPEQACFIVFDLLPLTHPELFPPVHGDHVARYFRLIQQAQNLGFISDHTRQEYSIRLRKDRLNNGPVLRLGSDSLGPRGAGHRGPDKPLFVALGTIEPRKNHELILDTFESDLLKDDCPFRLAFIGQCAWAPADLVERIRKLDRDCENFTFHEGLGDGDVGRVLSQAWAMIAVSSVEGFGLPAVESLWLGVPVIATRSMPSVENLDLGVEKLDELSVETLRSAVLRMLDPIYREAKTAGAKAAELQTWENFGLQVCRWVSGASHDSATKVQWEFRSRIGEPTMVSSAQNLEDVMLARVFRHKPQGFYIDVGAMDPWSGSVTRYFYDLGWRGINIEPDPRFFGKLVDARPRDTNLDVVLSSRKGLRQLYVLENIGMSTIVQERAESYRVQEQRSVEARTLADVCEEFAPREIDFLKVDVEGAEADVLRGGDWLRFRPKIVVVESTAPFSYEPTWQEWHPLLTLAGYQMVYEDGINRFYCRGESAALAGAFRLPPNVLDHYTTMECVEERRARLSIEDEVVRLRQEISELRQGYMELEKKSQG